MIHVREETHKRLTETLAPLVGTGGIKAVLTSKIWPSERESLPAGAIYYADEVLSFKAGRQPGHRVVQRVMQFFAVGLWGKPMGPRNTLEADQHAFLAAVERLLAADPFLVRSGVPLLSDMHPSKSATGLDASSGISVALAAMPIVAVAHHLEGRPDVTLPQASF